MAMQNLTCHRHSHKKSKSLVFLKIDTHFFLFEFLWIDYLRILIYLNPNLRLRLGLINKRNRLKGSCMNNTYLLFCSQTSGLTRWPHQQLSYKKAFGQINILLGIVNKVSNCILLHKPGLGQGGRGSWRWGQRGLLSYLAPTGMCCCTGYDFQGLGSETGYTIFLFNVLKWVSVWTKSF